MTYDKTTVERIGNIVLIGEEHGNERCAELAEAVLDGLTPRVCAVEHRSRRGAIGAIKEFAPAADLPRVKIDGPRYFRETVDDTHALIETANHFEYPIEEDGDLDERAPQIAREMVRDEYGIDTHREMYPERERYMARRLNALERDYGLVVAAVGAFHVQAIAEMLPRVGAMDEIDPLRVRGVDNEEVADPPVAEV